MSKNYTEEEIVEGFKKFHLHNGRFPAQADLRATEYLPDAKTLERRYGGIVSFRKKFNLGGDLRKGVTNASKRTDAYHELEHFLVAKFGRINVHSNGGFLLFTLSSTTPIIIDVFYSDRVENITSCTRLRLKKPETDWIVCLNPDLQFETMSEKVVSLDTFKKLCDNYQTNI